MRSDRLARVLLSLYPHAWRARYGDEFLALIVDTGLSWRGVVDVLAAAGIERVRAVAALVRYESDPTAVALSGTDQRFRTVLADHAAFMACVGLLVAALGGTGVPRPSYMWWFVIFGQYNTLHNRFAGLPRRVDRLASSFFWFVAAVILTCVGCLIAAMLGQLGLHAPSDGMALFVFVIFFMGLGFRVLYCAIRSAVYGSAWPGMHQHEIHAWQAAYFMVVVELALTGAAAEGVWGLAGLFWMMLQPPFDVTRAGAARRMALHAEMERRSVGAGSSGDSTNTTT